jgi:anti-sigma factor RsiW
LSPTVLDRLPDFLLGNLSPDETQQMADLLAQSPELARELAIVHETMALRAAMLRPVEPSARARERLVSALFGADRFRPFVDRLCRLVDLSDEAVHGLLARIDDAAAWQPGPLPGIKVIHFEHGPALLGAETGLVRIAAGQAAPRHRHVGAEVSFVLEGTLWEGETCYFPGQALPQPAGSVHTFTAGTERDLVFAVSHCGIEFM